jgi:hypothetical protein
MIVKLQETSDLLMNEYLSHNKSEAYKVLASDTQTEGCQKYIQIFFYYPMTKIIIIIIIIYCLCIYLFPK